MNRRLISIIPVSLSALLFGCGDSNPPETDPRVELGEALFMENCTQCHPHTGRGDYLDRIPATLVSRRSEFELMKWIEGSDKHREMPNFDHLSEEERASLAAYIFSETLGKKPY